MSNPLSIKLSFHLWKTVSATLIIISLFTFPFILDYSLSPRFILTAVSLTAFFYSLHKSKKCLDVNINLITLSYIGFVGWSCLSTFWSHNISEAIFENTKLLLGLGVFFSSLYFLNLHPEKFSKCIYGASVIILLCLCIVVLWQMLSLTGLGHSNTYSINGLNGHKNLLSSFLFLNLCFLLMAYSKSIGTLKKSALIAIVLNLILILFLRTKAVWLALIITAFVYFLLKIFQSTKSKREVVSKPFLIIVIIVIGLNIFFLFGLNSICAAIIQKQTSMTMLAKVFSPILDIERITVWHKTYLIMQQPFTGFGSGNWQVFFPSASLSGLWRAEDLGVSFQRPHNDFLWILSETGTIGFNIYLVFVIGLLVFGFIQLKSASRLNQNFNHFPLFFLVGYLCISFFDFPKERIEHIVWLNILMALIYEKIKKCLPFTLSIQMKIQHRFVFIFLFACIAFIGVLRCRGEYYTRQMYIAKSRGENQQIIACGKAALSFCYHLDPTSVPVEWYMGNAYSNQKNYRQANAYFELAYQQNPYQRNVLNDLASCKVMLGKIDEATLLYMEATRISPRFDDPKLNLASIYLNQNKLLAAKQCLDSLLHDSERRTRYYEILKILETQKQ
ncbi:MAG: O-antigen ligase family protein [Bacteroidota bacterium]